jgi:hypothetical protein
MKEGPSVGQNVGGRLDMMAPVPAAVCLGLRCFGCGPARLADATRLRDGHLHAPASFLWRYHAVPSCHAAEKRRGRPNAKRQTSSWHAAVAVSSPWRPSPSIDPSLARVVQRTCSARGRASCILRTRARTERQPGVSSTKFPSYPAEPTVRGKEIPSVMNDYSHLGSRARNLERSCK